MISYLKSLVLSFHILEEKKLKFPLKNSNFLLAGLQPRFFCLFLFIYLFILVLVIIRNYRESGNDLSRL